MNNSLAIHQNNSTPSVAAILEQKALIQDAMKSAMQDGQHFGKIPGCGDKPTLLQPGAQTILLLFRMNPDYDTEVVDLDRGHREYRIKCRLTNSSGEFIGAGVGSCSTMEGKWRFRVAPKQLTDREVPKGYWDLRKADPKAAQVLLGGNGFSTKKNESGIWMIAEGTSEKVEHDNPADYYNTCFKMAKKRALVDATLTRTAASDIFTQDVEDLRENASVYENSEPLPPQPRQETQQTPPRPPAAPKPATQERKPMSEPVTLGDVTRVEAKFTEYKEVNSKPDAPKPWKAFFCKFEDENGQSFEAGTFSATIGENLPPLQGQNVILNYKPGKKPGTFEIVSIEPSDFL